jgi:hypothetical protein
MYFNYVFFHGHWFCLFVYFFVRTGVESIDLRFFYVICGVIRL